jgi:hypothetical protein
LVSPLPYSWYQKLEFMSDPPGLPEPQGFVHSVNNGQLFKHTVAQAYPLSTSFLLLWYVQTQAPSPQQWESVSENTLVFLKLIFRMYTKHFT